ncbi:MAG: SLC13 family permease [Sphingorhabdus sp.]
MISTLTPHAAASILLAALVFFIFATERLKVEIVSLLTIGFIALGLYFFPMPDMVPNQGLMLAFEGFGHPALITICALMIMGRGLVVTGALDPAARALRSVWHLNHQLGLLVTLLLAFGMSMMINDTPVLVLLLPILTQLGMQGAMPASKTLIPVNAAVLIGGMATTIGTSTNLLVVSIAQDLGMPSIGVFDFSHIVLIAALIAFPYIWLVMPRLLHGTKVEQAQERHNFLATFRIGETSPALGKDLADLQKALPSGFSIMSLVNGPLVGGSRMSVQAPRDSLIEAARILGASAAPTWLIERITHTAAANGDDIALAEMAVTNDSRLVGRTLQNAALEGVAVLGVDQARRFIHEYRAQDAEAPLREGDVLLAMGTEARLQQWAQEDALLMLAGVKELPRSSKAPLALFIMALAVGVASLGLIPIAITSLAGAVAMFVTGCVKFERVGRALSAQVIVLIAASLAIGKLILVSGAAHWLGEVLAIGLQHLVPAAVLAAIMLFVTVLTNFASNATAAAVGTPIAFSLAQQLGLPVEPMVLAVLFGCNLCYATPVAYQTNMLIMAEGEYQFRDYMRTGIPLVVIMIISLSALLSWQYGL